MHPTGKIIIIGGAINHNYSSQFMHTELQEELNLEDTNIFRRILFESKHKVNSRVEIVTTASQIPLEIGPKYASAFNCFGAKSVGVLHINTRKEAMSKEIVDRLRNADVLMCTGGDQLRLTSILGGTDFHDVLLAKYADEEFVYAGTSAGAAAASGKMIYGPSNETILKGTAKVANGLGLLNHVIIDTHFIERSRMGRLMQIIVSNPSMLGIGLGEDAGLIVTGGNTLEAIGSGLTILLDGREIKETNLTQIENGQPLSINQLTIHVMSKFDRYDLDKHALEIRSFPNVPQFLN